MDAIAKTYKKMTDAEFAAAEKTAPREHALAVFKERTRRMRAAKKAADALDKRIAAAYYSFAHGIQINMLDIPKVFAVGRHAIENGADDAGLVEALRTYVETIRKN